MKFLDDAYNKIPNSVIGLADFIANALSVITIASGAVIGIGKLISHVYLRKRLEDFPWHWFFIIALSLVLVMLFIRNRKLITVRMAERKLVSKKYYDLLHDYRNTINEMECFYKRKTLTVESLTLMVDSFLKDGLGCLSDTLTYMTGYEVCSCVKSIIGEGFDNIEYRNARVKTFVRSQNSKPERKSYDVNRPEGVRISENTDFMDIVSKDRIGNDSAFYQPDLKEYDAQLRKINKSYQNTTLRWDEYYIGTIVVPIRIANSRLFYTNAEKSYNTLGFLCVDSMSNKAFPLKQKENYTNIMKSYAAMFYNIMNKYKFYLSQLTIGSAGSNSSVKAQSNAAIKSNAGTWQSGSNQRKKRNRRRK